MSEQKKIDAERAAFNDYLNEVVETKHYGMKTIKLQRHDEYTVDDEKIAWDAWQARASLPVGVPDGLFLGDALLMWNRRHDIPPIKVGYEYGVADALLQTLTAPAAPTVKAEQVPADRAALVAELREAAGEIARAGHFGWGNSMTAAADALAAPSLPSAGSAELIAEAERCLFVLREIGSMDGDDITGDDVDLRFEDDEGRDTGCDVSIVDYAEKSADVIEKMIAALSSQAAGSADVGKFSVQCGVCKESSTLDDRKELSGCCWACGHEIDLDSQLRAALSAKQSAPDAPERVSVPVELLRQGADLLDAHSSGPSIEQNIADDFRALLAGHQQAPHSNGVEPNELREAVKRFRDGNDSHGRGEA